MNTTDTRLEPMNQELDEILFYAFVGLFMRDENGYFVSLDDKFNVLKDDLKKDLLSWKDKEVERVIYSMHKDFIGTGYLDLGQEIDQAFNYARIHRWIDNFIERQRLGEK